MCDVVMKTCIKCGEAKPLSGYRPRGLGTRGECAVCENTRKLAWLRADRAANPERYKAYDRAHKATNPERRRSRDRERANALYRVDPEKFKARRNALYRADPEKFKARQNANTEALSDSYVRALLTARSPLTAADIPVSVVQLKRAQLQVTRALRRVGERHEDV